MDTIWEVDGAKEKVRTHRSPWGRQFSFLTPGEQLYLSLFGKLFIDIQTLFLTAITVSACVLIDCRSCLYTRVGLFYIFTNADSQRDHVLGFFSKV